MEFKSAIEIENNIQVLKLKQAAELGLLKQQIAATTESFKPINILKNTLQQLSDNKYIKNNILQAVIVLGTSFVIEKVLYKKPTSKLAKFFVSCMEFSIMKLISTRT